MKKSLLVWGVLIALALCFVGCCYYTTHCSHGMTHCYQKQGCKTQACPANANDDTVETMTVEAVEIIPVGDNQGKAPAAGTTTPAPAKAAPAAAVPATK